ncbi:MAG: FAD-binding protein [Betaproteobacteria bacterium]|nr:FAD-binding protein [Betaproteobacteria bacterium]
MREIDTGVVIIGGGLAALRAALAAAQSGVATTMLLKGTLGRSGSSAIAGGGLAAVVGASDVPEDGIENHFLDTLVAGDFVNDPELVKTLVTLAPRAIREMEALGAEFVRKASGEIDVFLAPAHSYRRSVRVAGGGTARLMAPVVDQVRRRPVQVLEKTMALEIIEHQGRAAGVTAIRDGEGLLLRSRAVILASGGAGRIYPLTSNMEEATGDGYAMALRLGLALTGMEFVQFTPTALAYPSELEGTSTGGVLLGLPGTRLWNRNEERFMERYDPQRKEASTRAILSRAIQTEVVEGRGSPHGGVYLDLAGNDAETLGRLAAPFMTKLAPFGIDLTRDRIELAPAVHYFMGGVEINAAAQTALPGLFAAGEVAGGVQGSNRLSSNSLSDVAVYGGLAGASAPEFAARHRAADWRTLRKAAKAGIAGWISPRGRTRGSLDFPALHAELKRIMFASGGLVREEGAMAKGLAELEALRMRLRAAAAVGIAQARQYCELCNMVDVGEAVVRSARFRTESRGAHFRSDFPERDDGEWLAATRVFRSGAALRVDKYPLPQNRRYMVQAEKMRAAG